MTTYPCYYGSWIYLVSGIDEQSRTVRFWWARTRDADGYFQSWREFKCEEPDSYTRPARDMLVRRKKKKGAKQVAHDRRNEFQRKQVERGAVHYALHVSRVELRKYEQFRNLPRWITNYASREDWFEKGSGRWVRELRFRHEDQAKTVGAYYKLWGCLVCDLRTVYGAFQK